MLDRFDRRDTAEVAYLRGDWFEFVVGYFEKLSCLEISVFPTIIIPYASPL